jgi:hypothetical protein
VTEGNYLLLEGAAWQHARETIDEVRFLAPDESQRLVQLIGEPASRTDLVVNLTDRLP